MLKEYYRKQNGRKKEKLGGKEDRVIKYAICLNLQRQKRGKIFEEMNEERFFLMDESHKYSD